MLGGIHQYFGNRKGMAGRKLCLMRADLPLYGEGNQTREPSAGR
jgi:hypothetical protein